MEQFKTEYQRQFKETDFDLHRRRLAVDEDEHRITMEKERLIRSEQRNQTVEKELDEIKTDYKDLNQVEKRISKENIEMKENTKVMNSNLKKQMEINSIRE